MRQWNARILASLLWLKARYEFFTSRPLGRVSLLFFVIGIGMFFIPQPAQACDWTDIGCHIRSAILMIAGIIASFLAELIAIVLEYMIPVMLYNSFSTSPVVTAGWALVRDTVNMFFVIVLIVIAFGTIFGHSKFKWQQQVPKLLIFAVVINFSKTLAGIMIDFGQVIMLTFANALREIAAGNIIELFGLNKVNSFGAGVQGKPAADWDLVMASLAAVFILAWVLVIMVLLFAILLYRIVALWILIVLAPLAWFAGGAKDILQSNAYADWWAQFKCLVAIGPVVTFFLWLALSVAGAGNAAEGFDSGAVNLGNSANFFTEIFELQHFMSMVIGSAMIMAGLQTAQQICSVMSGTFLGKQLGRAAAFGPGAMQFGKGAALKTTAWGARKVGAGVRATGRAGLRGTGMLARGNLGKKIGLDKLTTEGRAERARKRAASAGTGVIGRWRARRNLELAGKLEGRRTSDIARVGESFSKQGTETKADLLNRFAKSPPKLGNIAGTQDEVLARFSDALGNKDVMEKFEKSGDIRSLWKNYGAKMEETYKGDKGMTDKIQSFKKKHAHLTGATADLKTTDDLNNLSVAAMNDTEVQTRMKNMKVEVKQGKNGGVVEMNGMAAAAAGHFGREKQKVAQGRIGDMDAASLSQLDAGTLMRFAGTSKIAEVGALAIENKNIPQIDQVVSGLMDKHDSTQTSSTDRRDIAEAIQQLYQKLSSTIDKKEGSPRFLARAESLQNMIRKDAPVPLPPTKKDQTEITRIQKEITKKESALEGEMDIGKRNKINDEIASLREKMAPLQGPQDTQKSPEGSQQSTAAIDLSSLTAQLSSLEESLSSLEGSLQSDNGAPPSQEVLTRMSQQLDTMIQQAEKQAQLNKPEVKTGFAALKEKFGDVMKAGTSSTLSGSSTTSRPATEQKINVDELKEALGQFNAKLREQNTLIAAQAQKTRSVPPASSVSPEQKS